VDEQSEHRKLKQATDAAAKIQRESGTPKDPTRLETTPEPLQKPSPVQVGGEAGALSSSQVSVAALHLMDELERLRSESESLRVERDGLIAQLAELWRSGVSEAESESVLRANELEAECDRLRARVDESNRRGARHLNKTGWIRNQVIKAVLAMDSGANPLEACQRARPILNAAIAETPAVPDGQCDPYEVERLRQHVAELADELKVRDRTLGQLADIAEERDALLVRVETLEQQAGRRPPNPMTSTAPPDAWKPEWQTPYENLVKMVRDLEAKVQVPPAGIGEWTRLVNCVERHSRWIEEQSGVPAGAAGRAKALDDALRRIARLECLLCGEEGSGTEMLEEMVGSEADQPSYRQVIAEVVEAKDQFGTLLGIVELDGKTIREHSEQIKVLLDRIDSQGNRLRELEERTTRKGW
jgi:hypothetical protein